MTGSDESQNQKINWAMLTEILDMVPAATFDLLLRNVEKTSERILTELADPSVDGSQACALAHELKGMLTNFSMIGAGDTAYEIEEGGGALSRRQEVIPRLTREIQEGLAAVSSAAARRTR